MMTYMFSWRNGQVTEYSIFICVIILDMYVRSMNNIHKMFSYILFLKAISVGTEPFTGTFKLICANSICAKSGGGGAGGQETA